MKKERPYTIRDVAKAAGVGMGTVSRVINDSGYVGEETRARVKAAIESLAFKPNFIASGMRSNRLRSIGVIVSDITNPMFAAIVQKAQQILLDNEYQLFLGVTNNDPELETQLFRTLEHQGVSGIMATLNDDSEPATATLIESLKVPVVLLNRALLHGRATVVANDQEPGCAEAIDSLVSYGHQRIGLLITDETTLPGRERRQALSAALARHRLALSLELTQEVRHDVQSGYEAMARLMAQEAPPSAVIVASNRALIGALDYLRQHQLHYPNDLSIIGFDETDVTRLLSPGITIVNRDFEALTTTAVNLLLQKIHQPNNEAHIVRQPTWLEQRESVARVAETRYLLPTRSTPH
ncbi:LacI family DNA-binding transcriptional regulator [Salinicola rhizosphaerae]|uniref:Transcriptional regulator n=1 Tax=Salinicola rhizosphaerae TaxID=1443141 RepID=A0ABQ3E2C6_9GAMM|nr:LacI family DNA-binding transcriptional regulator [Salinicola rhizosphaerae]GHB18773.1 transcriptional regulator [Salinicola rhizosphaerae]